MIKRIVIISIALSIGLAIVILAVIVTQIQNNNMTYAIATKADIPPIEGSIVGTGDMMWPLPSSKHITSPFGPRVIQGRWHNHEGIDIAAPKGSTIVAADTGQVVALYGQGSYGQHLIIYHGNDIWSLYAHCSKIIVKQGAKVEKGEKIAEVGSTGWSTGPHLHFEIRYRNEYGAILDPMKFVNYN